MKTKLVLITDSFPYGKTETFLENEIPYLAKEFIEVHIFPLSKNVTKRCLPDNIYINDSLILKNPLSFGFWLKNLSIIMEIIISIFHNRRNIWSYVRNIPFYYKYLKDNLVFYKILRKEVENKKLSDSVFYNYWFVNATLATAILKKKKIITKAISRTHRFDLYDEEWMGIIPFRDFKFKYLNLVCPISDHGYKYLRNKVKYPEKLLRYYLGVKQPLTFNLRKTTDDTIIVSCSSFVPWKRVELIVKILSNIKSKVNWVHFGGDDFENNNIKESAKNLPENISCEFKGIVPNTEVLKFYQNNYIDFFISTSKSEGLPVSMMEAISFGIPIIGCNVNGIPEIINEKTGILIEKDFNVLEVARKIEDFLEKNYYNENRRMEIVNFFKNTFSSEKAFPSFIKQIKEA